MSRIVRFSGRPDGPDRQDPPREAIPTNGLASWGAADRFKKGSFDETSDERVGFTGKPRYFGFESRRGTFLTILRNVQR